MDYRAFDTLVDNLQGAKIDGKPAIPYVTIYVNGEDYQGYVTKVNSWGGYIELDPNYPRFSSTPRIRINLASVVAFSWKLREKPDWIVQPRKPFQDDDEDEQSPIEASRDPE